MSNSTMEEPTSMQGNANILVASSGTTNDDVKESSNGLNATSSIGHGKVEENHGDHGADTELRRILSSRHITMIALGSSIGMGLWLGSGQSLVNGGPAALFLGYLLAGSIVWCVSRSIGELAILYPLPSAFVQWSGKFVSEPAAFALGWAYWFAFLLTIGNELTAANTVLRYWTSALPIVAWITIFWFVIVAVNIGAVTVLGEVEVVMSSIKFSWIFVVLITCIVISAGGAPQGDAIGFRYWNEEPFTNGFKGFLAIMPTCIFAMAGSENCGLVAAECANPRRAVPKAVRSIWLRLSVFYLLGSLMVTITVSPRDPDIFGGSGTNASPFVLAYRDSGLTGLAHCMNAIILLSVLSTGILAGYTGSRTTVGLAHLKMAPQIFKRADKTGRPWAGLIANLLFGGAITYMNVAENGATVFSWLSNLTSLFNLFGWGMICYSHIRMRAAWKAQGRSDDQLPWKSRAFPFSAYWGITWCVILIVVEFYLAVWPLNDTPSAKHFFANYASVIIILALFAGASLYYRGPWLIPLEEIDLDSGRRFYRDSTDEEKLGGPAQRAMNKFKNYF